MTGLLDIPRELFLAVCAYLEQPELLHLSTVSRFAYVATQSSLYERVTVSTYPGLIKLTRTLGEPPVVTAPDQRSHLDSSRCERKIASLDIGNQPCDLDPQNTFNFYHLAQLLTAIARRCPRVETTLRLTNKDVEPIIGLPYIVLPRVVRVIVSAHPRNWQMDGTDYWTFFLGGHVFPDLHCLESNGFPYLPKAKPLAIEDQMMLALEANGQRANAPSAASEISCKRLEYLRSLKIRGDATLDAPRLHSILGSTQIPVHLTTLEIVNCPTVFFGAHIPTLKTLLQRSLTELPELRKLKLHLVEDVSPNAQNPQDHLCDVVRTHGQNIPHLDLALPFACSNIFASPGAPPPQIRDSRKALGPPTISREPLENLPQRLIDQGYKYRRLICWFNVCFGSHDWDLMTAAASSQGAEYSWEIVDDEAGIASWYLGDYDGVHFSAADVVGQPY